MFRTPSAAHMIAWFMLAGSLAACATAKPDVSPTDKITEGQTLLLQDQAAQAKTMFAAALATEPQNIRALNGLGIAEDELGQHQAAQAHYYQALKIEPRNLAVLNNLAYSDLLTGQYQAAITLLEPELNNPQAMAGLRQNLALAYGLAGMDVDAARVAKRDLSPEQVAANLAYYQTERQRLAAATPSAALGSYSTAAMAQAVADRLGALPSGVTPVITPEVAAPGSTPRFVLKLTGFAGAKAVADYCATLKDDPQCSQ